ncbi:MAG: PKD domain-containing protein [Bacteroidetes bacterium]|nr:PKD domain-containing protein [Bacteroidota bacterium]
MDSVIKIITIPADSNCTITASFKYYKDSLDCKKIHFINTSSPISPNVHFVWNFGDGTSSNDINPVHTYAANGSFVVSLVSEAGTGCRKQVWDSVFVKCGVDSCNIVLRFSYRKDSSNCKNIIFTNLSSPVSATTHFSWQFGDGTSSTAVNPSHVYAANGTYLVSLVSENSSISCRKQIWDTVIVKCPVDSCVLKAGFTWRKDSSNCRNILFTNLSSPVSASTHFSWTFGDGTSSTAVNPSHVYAANGTYLVSLVAESGTNCRKQVWDTVIVKCPVDSCVLKASFTWHKDSLNCKTVYFSNLSTPIPSATHFNWNFGDGSSSTAQNPVHTYASSGTYLVSLVVESGTNCRRQVWDSVYVKCADSCAFQPVFVWRADSSVTGKIYFSNLTVGGSGVHYSWFFGDSSAVSHDVSPTHNYTRIGTYYVCLVAENGSCRRQYCQPVFVDKLLNAPGVVAAIPNPAISSVTINVTLDRPETVIIRILDGNGIVREEFSKNGVTGNNRFTLPVERLTRGIYLIEIHTGSHRWFSRFQKG